MKVDWGAFKIYVFGWGFSRVFHRFFQELFLVILSGKSAGKSPFSKQPIWPPKFKFSRQKTVTKTHVFPKKIPPKPMNKPQ